MPNSLPEDFLCLLPFLPPTSPHSDLKGVTCGFQNRPSQSTFVVQQALNDVLISWRNDNSLDVFFFPFNMLNSLFKNSARSSVNCLTFAQQRSQNLLILNCVRLALVSLAKRYEERTIYLSRSCNTFICNWYRLNIFEQDVSKDKCWEEFRLKTMGRERIRFERQLVQDDAFLISN